MKKFAKILALILCLAMAFALCACGNSDTDKSEVKQKEEVKKTDEELLVGKWEAEIDMTDIVVSSIAEELGEEDMAYFDFGKIIAVYSFDFDKDGTYQSGIILTDKSINQLTDTIKSGFSAMIDDLIAESGMTKEDANTLYLESYDMTIDEYIDSCVEKMLQEFDPQQMFDDSATEGNWKVKDGNIYVTEDVDEAFDNGTYEAYEDLTEDSFTIINEFIGGEETIDAGIFPLTFSRVD